MFRRRSKSTKKLSLSLTGVPGEPELIGEHEGGRADMQTLQQLRQQQHLQAQQMIQQHHIQLQQNPAAAPRVRQPDASTEFVVDAPPMQRGVSYGSADISSCSTGEFAAQQPSGSGNSPRSAAGELEPRGNTPFLSSSSSIGSSGSGDMPYQDPPWIKDFDGQEQPRRDDRKKLRGTRRQQQFQQSQSLEMQSMRPKSPIPTKLRASYSMGSPLPPEAAPPPLAAAQSAPIRRRMPKLFRSQSSCGRASGRTSPTASMSDSASQGLAAAAAAALTPALPPNADLVSLVKSGNQWASASQKLQHEMETAQSKRTFKLHGTKTKAHLLHLAVCQPDVTEEFVQQLINVNPRALSAPDDEFGRLPLHWACRSAVSADVLSVLLDANNHGAKVVDVKQGRLPLHYSVLHATNAEQVDRVWKAAKRATVHQDKSGRTPLELTKGNPNTELQLDMLAVLQGFHERKTQRETSMTGTEPSQPTPLVEDDMAAVPVTPSALPRATMDTRQNPLPSSAPPQTPIPPPDYYSPSPHQSTFSSEPMPVMSSPVGGNGHRSPHTSRKVPQSPRASISRMPQSSHSSVAMKPQSPHSTLQSSHASLKWPQSPHTIPKKPPSPIDTAKKPPSPNVATKRPASPATSAKMPPKNPETRSNSSGFLHSSSASMASTIGSSGDLGLLSTIAPNFSTAPLMPAAMSPTGRVSEQASSAHVESMSESDFQDRSLEFQTEDMKCPPSDSFAHDFDAEYDASLPAALRETSSGRHYESEEQYYESITGEFQFDIEQDQEEEPAPENPSSEGNDNQVSEEDSELLKEMMQNMTHLKDQIRLQSEELDYRNKRLEQITSRMATLSIERKGLVTELDRVEEAAREHSKMIEERKQAAEKLRDQIANLQAELMEVEADVEEAEEQAMEYEMAVAQSQSALEGRNDSGDAAIANLQREREQIKMEKDAIDHNLEQSKSELESLQAIADMVRLEQSQQ